VAPRLSGFIYFSMLSKNQIKHLSSLKMKKFRDDLQEFTVEGSKLVMEVLKSRFRVIEIFAEQEWISKNNMFLSGISVPVTQITAAEMERITALSSPGPVLALVKIPGKAMTPDPAINEKSLILALDDIRDPGNLGTIIRIADWFGIDEIACSENCVELYNPKVIQATMGSFTRIHVHYPGLDTYLSIAAKNGTAIYGAILNGVSVYEQAPSFPAILLIGNESRGIRPELEALITHRISIPFYGDPSRDKAESLNASVAAGILCGEFRRKQAIGNGG
jgi:TrmH family RNA methyltransferase